MKLDQHISDLLYRYDCVIVPDFGGFIANYQPAKINSRTHTFSPPAKKLSFNRNLKSNDGLLASQIVQQYGVSFEDALLSISNCVNNYKRELNSGKRVLIENVGVLYQDEGKNILFEPVSTVNYLTDAFGLEKFHALPAKEEVKVISIDKVKRKKIHPLRIAAAIALPLFFVGSAMMFQTKGDGKYGQIQLSNLGFDSEISRYEIRNSAPTFSTEELNGDNFNALIEKAESRTFIVEENFSEEENWFIVGGCFTEKSNAASFVKKLKKEGYPAKQIKHYKKLHAVAYKGFAKESDAREFLASIKQKDNVSAWLLKK